MTDNTQQDIYLLRHAVQDRDWTTTQDIFKRVLTQLDPLVALSVVAPRLQAFVPKFQHFYPEAKWVRDLMLTVVVYGSSPRELPIHAVRDFPSPGCGNFLMGVFDLARTVQTEHTIFERYSFITNAGANAILAQLQYTYFKNRPDLYALYRDSETDDATRQAIQTDFWLDDVVAKTDVALWTNLIETLISTLEKNG
jgi:hypothetical protein